MIIGLSGKKGSGKTTVAAALAARTGGMVFSFAGPLKRLCVEVLGCEVVGCYGGGKDDPSPISRGNWYAATGGIGADYATTGMYLTHRELMQEFGTFIRSLKPDAWIRATMREVAGRRFAVIDDVRFRNEAEAIRAAGGVVVRLDGGVAADPHPSESDLDDWDGFALRMWNLRTASPDFLAAEILERVQHVA